VALDLLDDDPDGFFLMVEGGRIDHACHSNNLSRSIGETLAFDEAVRVVVDWAGSREDSLVLVTADHETGGLTVLSDNGRTNNPTVTWSTTGHTATPVPIYGWGLNAHLITNVVDNTNIHEVAISDATVPEQCLSIEETGSEGIRLVWTAASGDVYRVAGTVNLTSNDWVSSVAVTATSTRLTIVDTNAVSGSHRFYRLISIEGNGP